MSKTKNKNRSETEYLSGKIRELESQNRQLKKRLKQLDKKAHLYEDLVEAVAEDIIVEEKINNCKKCRVGVLKVVDLKHASFIVCESCKDRKRI